MPFIDCKVTSPVTEAQEEEIKTRLGKAIPILRKSEAYLMVGVAEQYSLYMAGKKLEKGAFVSVSLYGEAVPTGSSRMTEEICRILGDVLAIPPEHVYVTYQAVENWGWNGTNF